MKTPDTWTEADVEDWVCMYPAALWNGPCSRIEVVGRQITLPSGTRLDVLLAILDPDHAWRLVVVEIKRGRLDASALTQLLGYLEEVRSVFSDVRVSGVLLGAVYGRDMELLVGAMRGVHLATYHAQIDIYGVWDSGNGHRPGWVDGEGDGDEQFGDLRKQVNGALRRVVKARRRDLPVRLDDTPSRIYGKL